MARINVDSDALQDPRIVRRLPRYSGLAQFDALGRLLHVWALGYARKSVELSEMDIEEAADHVGFAGAMVLAGLAEMVSAEPPMYRVAGLESRIGYLVNQAAAARAGGESRQAGAVREGGRFVKSRTNHQLPAGERQPSPGESPADQNGSPGSDQPSTSRSSLLYSGSTLDLGREGAAHPTTPPPLKLEEPRGKTRRSRSAPKPVETPIPDDFEPNAAARALAAELQLDLAAQVGRWRDKAAAKGWTWIDHQAALRTWLRNAAEFRDRDRGAPAAAGRYPTPNRSTLVEPEFKPL